MGIKYWSDKHRTLYNSNCRAMSELSDESIQMCVTSPPYWGLRKYAGEQDSIWGGTPDCSHEWGREIISKANDSNRGTMKWTTGGNPAGKVLGEKVSQGNTCSLCGAWRGAYGLEPSVEMYVQHTVEILREIRRVLRPDGVCFWNVGDSYASTPGLSTAGSNMVGTTISQDASKGLPKRTFGIIKPKDLCLIPFRVALAAQSDGWWVRSDIIWNKPNPMPESVTDRPTDSYEHIFLFTKSARYYWDMEAVREPQQESSIQRAEYRIGGFPKGDIVTDSRVGYVNNPNTIEQTRMNALNGQGRNLRNVWTFPTQPYREAHFATFPEALPERCIKAATPEVGCCSKCGTAWERIVEKFQTNHDGLTFNKARDDAQDNTNRLALVRQHIRELGMESVPEPKTIGWQPGCECNADKVPSIILDPFCGSGTTLEVAAKLNRHAVGYEISEEYCKLIVERNNQAVLL